MTPSPPRWKVPSCFYFFIFEPFPQQSLCSLLVVSQQSLSNLSAVSQKTFYELLYNNGNTYLHYRHPSQPRVFTGYSFFHRNTLLQGLGQQGGEGDLFFRSYILLNITIPQRSIILTHTRIHQQIYSFKIKIFKQTSYTLPHRIMNFYYKSSIILICAKFLLVFTPVYLLISAPCPEWFLEIRILHSFFP